MPMRKKSRQRILFIEDDEVLAVLVRDGLSMLGFEVICRYSLDEILTELESLKPDVLLLDLDIQGTSSEFLLPKIRILSPKMPIIIASSFSQGSVIKRCLTGGSNYYIKKPYEIEEVAGVIAMFENQVSSSITIGTLQFDPERRIVMAPNGQKEILSPKESELLALLIASRNQVLIRENLLMQIWGDLSAEKSLNNSISHLRQILKWDSSLQIRTYWKGGYELIY